MKTQETHNPVTRFSVEQVIIAQLHGSTESSSQLLRTPCGSFKALLILIKASTAKTINHKLSINHCKEDNPDRVYLHGCEARRREMARQRRERTRRGRRRATWPMKKKAKWRACLFQRQ